MSNEIPSVRHKVARLDDLQLDEVTTITVADREIALFRVEAGIYATDNSCTHGAARLCDGFLDGFSIECPLHQGMFDIRSGAVVRAPAVTPLLTYKVELVEGDVYLLMDPQDP